MPRTKSRQNAKDRIRFILQYDRSSLSAGRVEELKQDLLSILPKYVNYDEEKITISVEQEDRRMNSSNEAILVLNIPIKTVVR